MMVVKVMSQGWRIKTSPRESIPWPGWDKLESLPAAFLFLPPIPLQAPPPASDIESGPAAAPLVSLPGLQDDYDRLCGRESSVSALYFRQVEGLRAAAPGNWLELNRCFKELQEDKALNLVDDSYWWSAEALRGALLLRRLPAAGWEINMLLQILIWLAVIALSAYGGVAHGEVGLSWSALFLLYLLNRGFLKSLITAAPERIITGLLYCCARPLVWLWGMLGRNPGSYK
jgi:hypothetical protein